MRMRAIASLLLSVLVCVRAAGALRTADITHVKYGAEPDDGKDDTAAIQAAIDSLPGGGHVIVPSGTFNVSMAKGITIKPSRLGEVTHYVANIGKARALLGYNPAVSLREGIAKAVAWSRDFERQERG